MRIIRQSIDCLLYVIKEIVPSPPDLIRKTAASVISSSLARGSDMLSFQAVAGSSHDLIAGISFNLTSEISLVTALRLCNPQLLDVAIG